MTKPYLRVFTVWLFFVVTVGFVAGCVTSEYNVGTRSQDIYFYSTEKEVTLGQNVARKIAEEYDISKNPYAIERVSELGNEVAGVCDRQEISYYFYVIDDDEEVNAFAVPGGYVYITTGLLDKLKTDDQLAFVLAHEVAHIVSRHSVKKMQAAMGYNLLLVASTAASRDPGFTSGLAFALAQVMTAYSREDELNADELAAQYMQTLGRDATAGIQVLEILYAYKKEKIRPLSYFRTHPYATQRIRHIKETLRLPLDLDDYMN